MIPFFLPWNSRGGSNIHVGWIIRRFLFICGGSGFSNMEKKKVTTEIRQKYINPTLNKNTIEVV